MRTILITWPRGAKFNDFRGHVTNSKSRLSPEILNIKPKYFTGSFLVLILTFGPFVAQTKYFRWFYSNFSDFPYSALYICGNIWQNRKNTEACRIPPRYPISLIFCLLMYLTDLKTCAMFQLATISGSTRTHGGGVVLPPYTRDRVNYTNTRGPLRNE